MSGRSQYGRHRESVVRHGVPVSARLSTILHTGKKVVVIIDDLERAYDSELLTIFQIVRLSANFKKTLFVLAYDQAQLQTQLEKLGLSTDFLGKIVQNPVDLPAADKNEIDRFVIYSDSEGHKSQIDKLLDKLKIAPERRKAFDKKSVELYTATLSPFFSTLRNAKRFLTGFFSEAACRAGRSVP
jgi:KAP-like P-loop domain-containing protein